MLQLSHQARLRAKPGFICASCRHTVLQQQQQRQQTAKCSTLKPASAGVAVTTVSSSSALSPPCGLVPSTPHSSLINRCTFSTSRPSTNAPPTRSESESAAPETPGVSIDDSTAVVGDGEKKKRKRRQKAKETETETQGKGGGKGGGKVKDDGKKKSKKSKMESLESVDDTQPTDSTSEPALAGCDSSTAVGTVKKKKKSRKRKSEGEIEGDGESKVEAKSEAKKKKTPSEARGKGTSEDKKVSKKETGSRRSNKSSKKRTAEHSRSGVVSRRVKIRKLLSAPNDKTERGIELQIARRRKALLKDPSIIDSDEYKLIPVDGGDQPPVARLTHHLDRVLFNPGVYHLQDPRSRVYNFDPYLARIIPLKEFDFGALKKYITSSEDTKLLQMTNRYKREYTGSTSSMTSMLSHFHFLLSGMRPIDALATSRHYEVLTSKFPAASHAPVAAFLHYKDGVYAIDADKEFDNATILMLLGQSMEKLLTVPKRDFKKYHKGHSSKLTDKERNTPEPYHYSVLGKFLMRSQIDAYDPRLPGTGTFDLKTRAVAAIRLSSRNIKNGLGYEIRDRFGQWESYEREYHDLARSGFLKYSLQVRIGRMDGCFVAYHNTERIFGFQYIPLSEMDQALHGTPDPDVGDRELKLSMQLLEKALDKATERFPKRSLRLHVETRPGSTAPFMYFFAEPVTAEQINKVQEKTRKQVDELEREVMVVEEELETGLGGPPTTASDAQEPDAEGGPAHGGSFIAGDHYLAYLQNLGGPFRGEAACKPVWSEVLDKVNKVMGADKQGPELVRNALESALLESALIKDSHSKSSHQAVHSLLTTVLPPPTVWTEPIVSDSQAAPESVVKVKEVPSFKARLLSFAARIIPSLQPVQTQEPPVQTQKPAVNVPEELVLLKNLVIQLVSNIKTDPSLMLPPQESEQAARHEVTQSQLKLQKFMGVLSFLVQQTPSAAAAAGENDSPSAEAAEEEETPKELLALIITAGNIVNGEHVSRPAGNRPIKDWRVTYSIEEVTDEARALKLYSGIRERRRKAFSPRESTPFDRMFEATMRKWAARGRAWREAELEAVREFPVHVVHYKRPVVWNSVFGEEAARNPASKYATWRPQGMENWATSQQRHHWIERLKTMPPHVPRFESSSSFHEHDPAKARSQFRASLQEKIKLEKKIARLRHSIRAQLQKEAKAKKHLGGGGGGDLEGPNKSAVGREFEASGHMEGLNLNQLTPEQEEEGILSPTKEELEKEKKEEKKKEEKEEEKKKEE